MSFTIWFTGLSGSGKSTLAAKVHDYLQRRNLSSVLLDGDVVRSRCPNLGFSKADRITNIRAIGRMALEANQAGQIAVVGAIAPYQEARLANRCVISRYVEVFCDCPLEVVAARDVKGLYKKAFAGEIKHFTGVSDPYERPVDADVVVRTDLQQVEASLAKVIHHLKRHGLVKETAAPSPKAVDLPFALAGRVANA